MDKLQEAINRMTKDPYLLRMGATSLSKRLHTTVDVIYKAKKIIKGTAPSNLTPSTHLQDKTPIKASFPKILILDIETAPLKAYVWNRWKQNIYLEQTISEWFCICWAAKWLYSAEVLSSCLTSEEILVEDDSRIMAKLWQLLNQADIVVAHNGKRFDIPKINSRLLLNGLPPTSSYYQIDTLEVAKKQFGFSSNKLDALAGYFEIEHKINTSFSLWERCMRGDKEALNYMQEYNKKDVTILEEVYLKLRPWIKNHPNVGVYIDSKYPVCANCGSSNLSSINSFYYTSVGKYPLYRCECGAISRGRINVNTNKSALLTNVSR